MVKSQTTEMDPYLDAFKAFDQDESKIAPEWIRKIRRQAISRFNDLGFPTARQGNEEWKYTDVGPMVKVPFHYPNDTTRGDIRASDLDLISLSNIRWHQLVFVDGVFQENLSSASEISRGVKVLSLASAIADNPELVLGHLGLHAGYVEQAFTALNTAFLHDGAFVHIPNGVSVEKPIHLLFLTSARQKDSLFQPRVLVVTGESSKATIIESQVSISDSRYLSNAVSEVVVGPGGALDYFRIQQHSGEAFQVGTTNVNLADASTFTSMVVDLGGRLVRNNLNVLMCGEGASCTLNGIYLVTKSQHVDNQVIIDHTKPHTSSRELYKGILGDKSRAVFHGSIIVRPGAQKVDARQEDKNLLLSDQAEADTKPAFWIYADDVKCSHGASTGQLDDDALFYLRSRGLPEQAARSMLVRGFVDEVIDTIPSVPFKNHVEDLVSERLKAF